MQPPISMAQTATGMPSARSPGNIRAPNETIFAISSTAATAPAAASRPSVRLRSIQGEVLSAFVETERDPCGGVMDSEDLCAGGLSHRANINLR